MNWVEITSEEKSKKISEEIFYFTPQDDGNERHFMFHRQQSKSIEPLLTMLKEYGIKLLDEKCQYILNSWIHNYETVINSSLVNSTSQWDISKSRAFNVSHILNFLKHNGSNLNATLQSMTGNLLDVVAASNNSPCSVEVFLKMIELGVDPKSLKPNNLKAMIDNLLSDKGIWKKEYATKNYYQSKVREVWKVLGEHKAIPTEYAEFDIEQIISKNVELPDVKDEHQKKLDQTPERFLEFSNSIKYNNPI